MSIFTEHNRLGDWLKGELDQPKDFCREVGLLLAGEDLRTGTVLAKLTSGGQYVQLDPSASAGSGSDTVAGILITNHLDGDTSADQPCVVLRRGPATVSDNGIIWPDVISGGEKTAAIAALVALGIVVREGV